MREPAKPNASNPASSGGPGLPGVSIPDRRRIDSDVRAFLREPSTPWIVFDREGRPPSQLAALEVLPVALSSVIPEHGFFPATAMIDAAQASAARPEPSSLAVASDLEDDMMAAGLASSAVPMGRLRSRVLGAAAATVAIVGLFAFGAAALSATSPDLRSARSFAQGSPVAADLAPPDLDVKAAPPVVAPAAPTVAVAAPAPASEESAAKAAAKRFGRLSIAGDARSRDVFLDGKRLLGRGARSFTVMCGTHSIAVGTRTDAHDVDVPCNAELVLSK